MRLSRILIVEDFPAFRQAIRLELQQRAEFQVIGEARDGLEAVHLAQELQPDLILMDIGLPTLNGIEAARKIRVLAPEARLIFVSQESSPELVEETLRLGAQGYVHKPHAGTDLLSAIDAVLDGRRFVSDGLKFEDSPPKPSEINHHIDILYPDPAPSGPQDDPAFQRICAENTNANSRLGSIRDAKP
jgi:DNA-binding NarL/FixJ family response regulator